MVRAGKEDPEPNMLVGRPDPRSGGGASSRWPGCWSWPGRPGIAGGTVAGWGDDNLSGATGAGGDQPISGNRRNEWPPVYNWSDYIDDWTIPLFQAQANIRSTTTCTPRMTTCWPG